MSEKLYNKLLKAIHSCSDVQIKNDKGVVIGVGMAVRINIDVVNMLDEDCIILQRFDSLDRLATITPDGDVLEAFRIILEDYIRRFK